MIERIRECGEGTTFRSRIVGGLATDLPSVRAINRAIGQGLSNYKHLAQLVGGLLAALDDNACYHARVAPSFQ